MGYEFSRELVPGVRVLWRTRTLQIRVRVLQGTSSPDTLIKTFKGRLMSVPVFPYSNIVYFQFCSYSFNDPFVRHFIVLMRFWSFPNFHMKLLLLIKTFKGRSGPFRYFHTPTSDVFNSCSFLRPIFHISDKGFGLFPIFSYRFLFL